MTRRKRRTKSETEELRQTAYDLRQRGLSLRAIGQELGVTHQLVSYHLRVFLAQALEEMAAKTGREMLIEAIMRARHDRDYAARERERAASSRERLAWSWCVLKAGKRLDALLLESGLPAALASAHLPAVQSYLELIQRNGNGGQARQAKSPREARRAP